MTSRKSRYRPDQKGAALGLALVLAALFLIWWFGAPVPIPD
jgi:hypothetical protein